MRDQSPTALPVLPRDPDLRLLNLGEPTKSQIRTNISPDFGTERYFHFPKLHRRLEQFGTVRIDLADPVYEKGLPAVFLSYLRGPAGESRSLHSHDKVVGWGVTLGGLIDARSNGPEAPDFFMAHIEDSSRREILREHLTGIEEVLCDGKFGRFESVHNMNVPGNFHREFNLDRFPGSKLYREMKHALASHNLILLEQRDKNGYYFPVTLFTPVVDNIASSFSYAASKERRRLRESGSTFNLISDE